MASLSGSKDSTPNLRPYYNPETFNGDYSVVFRPGTGVRTKAGLPIEVPSLSSKGGGSQSYESTKSFWSDNTTKQGISKFSRSKSIKVSDTSIPDFGSSKSFSDLEFGEYLDIENTNEMLQKLAHSFLRTYLKTIVSQPFEVSRLLVQIGSFQTGLLATPKSPRTPRTPRTGDTSGLHDLATSDYNSESEAEEEKGPGFGYNDDSSSDDDMSYFSQVKTDTAELSRQAAKKRIDQKKRKRTSHPSTLSKTKKGEKVDSVIPSSEYAILPLSLHGIDILSAVLAKEGIRGIWRALNTTFIQNVLSSTLEAWLSGFLSPFFSIPDPYFIDAAHSPEPGTTLCVSLAVSVLTSLAMVPLDLIRTRMIVTSVAEGPRSVRDSVKKLKSYTCPKQLLFPTILHSFAVSLVRKGSPYVLYVKMGIDSYTMPAVYNFLTLISNIVELFVRLPLETVLRRAQVHYLSNEIENLDSKMIVKRDVYKGVIPTMFYIIYNKDPENENRGAKALFAEWKVGLIGVVSSWGMNVVRHVYDDVSLKEEKF